MRPRARRHVAARNPHGEMNKTEARYAMYLEAEKWRGQIAAYHWSPMKLRLAKATFYEPDFLVTMPDGQLEIHEVKGYWEDDARVKIKVAAEMFPFKFIAIKETRQGYEWEEF